MKKIHSPLLAFVAIPLLSGCASFQRGSHTDLAWTSPEKSLALQATSSFALLGKRSPAKLSGLLRKGQISDAEAKEIEAILPTLDLFLENGFEMESTILKEETTVDGILYDTMEKVTYEGADGKGLTLTLVYNLVSAHTKTETEKDEDGTEVTFTSMIEGRASLEEGVYFPFISYLEEEKEGNETETERTFLLTTGEKSYIQVQQEHEFDGRENEESFSYEVTENGTKTLEYEISLEKDPRGTSISYELGNKEYELTIVERNGESVYRVEYENESGEHETEATLEFRKVIAEDGSVSYVRI